MQSCNCKYCHKHDQEVICVSVDSVERAERFLRRGEPDPTTERGEARPTREPRLHLPRHGRDL